MLALGGIAGGCSTFDAGAEPTGADGGDAETLASDGASVDGAPRDAGPCDPAAPFGEPRLVEGVNSSAGEFAPHLTADEQTMLFSSYRSSAPASRVWIATAVGAGFGNAKRVDAIANATFQESYPSLSADGKLLVFTRTFATGESDLVQARKLPDGGFELEGQVPSINRPNGVDIAGFLSADGREIFFSSDRASGSGNTGQDLYRALLEPDGGVSPPTRVDEVATADRETTPVLSHDGLTLYFGSRRPDQGAQGEDDVWTAKRATTTSPFSPPTRLGQLSSNKTDLPSWVSKDGCRLYLASNRSGRYQIYVASRK